jgi:hypothetical protein
LHNSAQLAAFRALSPLFAEIVISPFSLYNFVAFQSLMLDLNTTILFNLLSITPEYIDHITPECSPLAPKFLARSDPFRSSTFCTFFFAFFFSQHPKPQSARAIMGMTPQCRPITLVLFARMRMDRQNSRAKSKKRTRRRLFLSSFKEVIVRKSWKQRELLSCSGGAAACA